MKRLAWLVLLAFGTLLVQVPAVEPLGPAKPHCACGGKCAGRCGMPDCTLPTSPFARNLTSDRTATLVRPATKRAAPVGERLANRYLVLPLAALNMPPALRAPGPLTPAASVPLFREHCSPLL